MEVKVSLAETLKDWLSRKEMYSFSCSGFRRMAGVPLEDYFSSTNDIRGYAHIHSDSQQVSQELKSSCFPSERQGRWEKGTRGKHESRQRVGSGRVSGAHACQGAHGCGAMPAWRHQSTWNISWQRLTYCESSSGGGECFRNQEPPAWPCHKPANCPQVICWL